MPVAGNGERHVSDRALDSLRDAVDSRRRFGAVPGTNVHGAAGTRPLERDFNDTLKSHLPLVFGFVLATAFLLLLVTFRSIVDPDQGDHAEPAVGGRRLRRARARLPARLVQEPARVRRDRPDRRVAAAVPVRVLFGLSMDYHVFILTRVREALRPGNEHRRCGRARVKSTAGVVTSAAAVMVACSRCSRPSSLMDFKQLGVGLAVAVLIDATLIRGVLLPATMKLLGDHNWYLPRRLSWLPRVAHEPARA